MIMGFLWFLLELNNKVRGDHAIGLSIFTFLEVVAEVCVLGSALR